MKTRIEFLKNSLLFQMSLGSRELYHSNVWAWLIENDPDFVKVFFPDFQKEVYTVLGVSRECKHRDIIIWLQKTGYKGKKEKYFYVIENKIKSLQQEDQLKNYTENLWESTLLQGTITGIENNLEKDRISFENKSTKEQVVWEFVGYATISKRIRELAQSSTSKVIKLNLSQIKEYCDIINTLYDILNEALSQNKDFVWYWGNSDNFTKELRDLRIEDMYIKLQGSRFIHYIKSREELFKKLCPIGFRLEVGQSFHNGKATIDVRFTNWKDKHCDYLTIGVQIEGGQYRLLVQKNGKHRGKEIFEEFKGAWFDANFNYLQKECRTIFGEKKTSMRKLFDSYGEGSGDYIFVYQYYNLTKENSRYEILLEEIQKDLTKAKKIIEQINF